MESPDCFYCQKDERLYELMLEIAQLNVSTLYLFKEQTYKGRCILAYNEHINELFELSDEQRNAFIQDVAYAARAINSAFSPKKINYGAYSDKLPHLHFHLVPKYENGPSFGSTFEMNPQSVYLSDEEYTNLIEKIKKQL